MSAPHEPFAGFDEVARGGAPRGVEPAGGAAAWARDLAFGARLAAGGGREGWIRTLLTAVGVGLGVALLLLAAAVPPMMTVRDHKRVARDSMSAGYLAKPTDSTLLVADAGTTFRGADITGELLRPEGAKAAAPPGVAHLPAPGHMVVSPALRRLLAAQPLLRERLPYTIDGPIGHAGLMGPAELYYYAGSDRLTARDANYEHGNADRIAGFGHHSNSAVMGPTFDLLLVVMLVVLLLPVAVFVATAVRLGGERRDRRLAALRLVGADNRMTRRIAAGEALFGSLLGLLVGGGLFFAGRQLATHVTIRGISAYPADMTPDAALAVIVAVAVPLAAVGVTMLSLRGTAIEPLGVVRQSVGRGRRVWWRLVIPAVGLLLAPLFGKVQGDGKLNMYQVATGAVLMLVGVTAVLPWVVEQVVRRLGGGPVAWQLATRRLQLNSNAAARLVSGVTVAVAGAIALQMLFAGVDDEFVFSTGADPARAQAVVSAEVDSGAQARDFTHRIAATKGVQHAYGYVDSAVTQPDAASVRDGDFAYLPVAVGDCATLGQMASLHGCAPGSVFLVPPADGAGDTQAARTYLRPGGRLDLNGPPREAYTGTPRLWTIPRDARTAQSRPDPSGSLGWGLFATPEALDTSRLTSETATVMVALDPHDPDAAEYVRNTAAKLGIGVDVLHVGTTTTKSGYAQLRRGLFAGAALTMALIGASLLVMMLEQLRDRKKLLAVLVAFGTRRGALAWSVLWQTAIPVVLGLVLACAGGLALGAALLGMVGRPFHPDWGAMAGMAAIGAGVVFAVTLLSLPPLWRLMRADGLRTE